MARPQNSAKGNFGKQRITISASGGILFNSYSETTALFGANSTGITIAGGAKFSGQANAVVTGNSTGIVVVGGIKLGAYQVRANSTALLLPTASTLPATRQLGGVAFVSNGTGKSLAFHSTGTTWVYAMKTSVLA